MVGAAIGEKDEQDVRHLTQHGFLPGHTLIEHKQPPALQPAARTNLADRCRARQLAMHHALEQLLSEAHNFHEAGVLSFRTASRIRTLEPGRIELRNHRRVAEGARSTMGLARVRAVHMDDELAVDLIGDLPHGRGVGCSTGEGRYEVAPMRAPDEPSARIQGAVGAAPIEATLVVVKPATRGVPLAADVDRKVSARHQVLIARAYERRVRVQRHEHRDPDGVVGMKRARVAGDGGSRGHGGIAVFGGRHCRCDRRNPRRSADRQSFACRPATQLVGVSLQCYPSCMSTINDQPEQPSDAATQGHLVLQAQHAPEDGQFDRLERFQALEPGYYWTALKDGGQYAPKGETLLLMDVTEFDGKVHSVTLRIHPRLQRRDSTFNMLVDDFLDVFVPNPDGEKVRDVEQQAVITRVAEMQSELARTSSDQHLLLAAVKEDVETGLAALEREKVVEGEREQEATAEKARNIAKTHRRAARRSAAKGNPLTVKKVSVATDVGGLIDGGINEQGVAELRDLAGRQAVVARAQANWLTTQTKAIAQTLESLTPYIHERSAVAIARTSGAVKMVERIKKGIESLDLYTGRGVEVYDLKTGPDAPTSEPLTVIQGKRYAEEEFAVWADVTAEFDFRNKEQFFAALGTDQGLLNQVLPTERCVVSMAMTRHSRQYSDPFASLMYNIQNALVFLLVRNGDNVHVVYSSSPSHEGAARLFPSKKEMDRPFVGIDGKRLALRDVEFGQAAKDFDNMALIYKRFLILLCGLDHRLKLFGDFYPHERQMQFMEADFQAAYFRFLADEDGDRLIGDSLPSLQSWWQEKNRMLQSGSRVYLLNSSGIKEAAGELKRRNFLRATAAQFETPFVVFKEAGELAVSLQAHDPHSNRGPVEKVNCFLKVGDSNAHDDAWWMCIDDVDVEVVSRFRHSRVNRSMGVSYLRLFRRLEDYLGREAKAERDARAYLLQAAVDFGGLTHEQALAGLGNAVRNWRAARRGAPLPTIDDKAALNDVLTLMVPAGHMTPVLRAMVEEYLQTSGVSPLLLTRTGKAKLMLYVVASDEDRAPYPNVLTWRWVKRITLQLGKTKLKSGGQTLLWMSTVLPASEVELRRWEGLDDWLNEKDEPISLRKYGSIPALLEGSMEWEPVLRAGPGAGVPESLFNRVFNEVVSLNERNRSGYTIDAVLAVPIGVYSKDGYNLEMVYMRAYAASVLWGYGSAEQRRVVAGRLSRSEAQRAKLRGPVWQMATAAGTKFVAHDVPPGEHIPQGNSNPAFTQRRIRANRKHDSFHQLRSHGRRGDKKHSGPSLTEQSVELSFDRALGQLLGTDTRWLRAAHHKALRKAAAKVGDFFWSTSGRNGRLQDDERAAAMKADRKAILTTPYVHPYRAHLSPLVWCDDKARPVANAVFVRPLMPKPAST